MGEGMDAIGKALSGLENGCGGSFFFKPIYSMRVLRVGVDSLQWKEDRKGNFCIKFYMVLYVVGTKSS